MQWLFRCPTTTTFLALEVAAELQSFAVTWVASPDVMTAERVFLCSSALNCSATPWQLKLSDQKVD